MLSWVLCSLDDPRSGNCSSCRRLNFGLLQLDPRRQVFYVRLAFELHWLSSSPHRTLTHSVGRRSQPLGRFRLRGLPCRILAVVLVVLGARCAESQAKRRTLLSCGDAIGGTIHAKASVVRYDPRSWKSTPSREALALIAGCEERRLAFRTQRHSTISTSTVSVQCQYHYLTSPVTDK